MTDHNEDTQYTFENMNIRYSTHSYCNEQTETGAILECSRKWHTSKLNEWLPNYDYDMLAEVHQWLCNDAQIAEGGYLEVWI